MKEVGFKPGVKDRGSYESADGESEEEKVMDKGTGESEKEELVPE